jgi:hypothetical protein
MKLIRKMGHKEFCDTCDSCTARDKTQECTALSPSHTNSYGRITRICSEIEYCPKHLWERVN